MYCSLSLTLYVSYQHYTRQVNIGGTVGEGVNTLDDTVKEQGSGVRLLKMQERPHELTNKRSPSHGGGRQYQVIWKPRVCTGRLIAWCNLRYEGQNYRQFSNTAS